MHARQHRQLNLAVPFQASELAANTYHTCKLHHLYQHLVSLSTCINMYNREEDIHVSQEVVNTRGM